VHGLFPSLEAKRVGRVQAMERKNWMQHVSQDWVRLHDVVPVQHQLHGSRHFENGWVLRQSSIPVLTHVFVEQRCVQQLIHLVSLDVPQAVLAVQVVRLKYRHHLIRVRVSFQNFNKAVFNLWLQMLDLVLSMLMNVLHKLQKVDETQPNS